MNGHTGKWMLIIGAVIIVAGLIVYFFHHRLHWVGRLPGDIRIEKENFRFYLPITTMIIFSILVTVIIHIARRLFHY